MNCSRLSATNKPSVSAFCLHIVEVIVIFLLPCWIQTQHANLLFLLAAWTKTESPWHWTSTPWWLQWNFISRVQADRVLSSGLRIYFGPNSDVNLNTPILLLCYTGASGPQFARNRDSSMGTQEALLCPPSSSSLFQLSQAATALCSYMTMHTNKHTTIDRSGRWFLSPTSMLCTWMKTDTHTQSGEHWPQLKHSPPPPPPRHLTLAPVELFSLTRSTLYLYYPAINRPLATAQLPPLYLCISCILATARLFFSLPCVYIFGFEGSSFCTGYVHLCWHDRKQRSCRSR